MSKHNMKPYFCFRKGHAPSRRKIRIFLRGLKKDWASNLLTLCFCAVVWILIKYVDKNLFILLKWQSSRVVTWREAARPTPTTSVPQTHWLTYAKSLQQQLKSNWYFKTGTDTSFWFVFPSIFEFWHSNSARKKGYRYDIIKLKFRDIQYLIVII